MIDRLVEEKGVVEFLDAAMEAAVRTPEVFFSSWWPRLALDHVTAVDDVIDRASKALGERLILAGFRDDVPQLLATMDPFCLPSWREGMPRTISEVMMMGLPVIATDIRAS